MMMRLCWQVFAVAIIFFATPSVAEPSYGGRLLGHVQNSREFAPPLILVAEETKRREPDTIILAFMSGKCSKLKIAGRDFACRAVAFYQTEQGRANFTIALDDPADNTHIITFSGENARKEQDNLYELAVDRMLLKSKDRKKYELQFESDGSPIKVMRLRESPVPTEKRRAKQIEQFGCRLKADEAKILPRDRTAYIIQCLGEDTQDPMTARPQ